MSQTPEEIAAEISRLASQWVLRSDLAGTAEPRRALYDLTSALSSVTGPLSTPVVQAGQPRRTSAEANSPHRMSR